MAWPSSWPRRRWAGRTATGGRRTAAPCWSLVSMWRRSGAGISPIRPNPDRPPREVAHPAAGTANADVSSCGCSAWTAPAGKCGGTGTAFEYLVYGPLEGCRPCSVAVQSRDQRRMQVLEARAGKRPDCGLRRQDYDPLFVDIVARHTGRHRRTGALVLDRGQRTTLRRLTIGDQPVTPPQGLQVRCRSKPTLTVTPSPSLGSEQLRLRSICGRSPRAGLPAADRRNRGFMPWRAGGRHYGRLFPAPSNATGVEGDRAARGAGGSGHAASLARTPVRHAVAWPSALTGAGSCAPQPWPASSQPGLGSPAGAAGSAWRAGRPAGARSPGAPIWCRSGSPTRASPSWSLTVGARPGGGRPGNAPSEVDSPPRSWKTRLTPCRRSPPSTPSWTEGGGDTGWSFGGFVAALAVLRRPDVFHAAVAGAPVTDHRLYDTHYMERYLGTRPRSSTTTSVAR